MEYSAQTKKKNELQRQSISVPKIQKNENMGGQPGFPAYLQRSTLSSSPQRVQRMCAECEKEEAQETGGVQTKLSVGAANDPYEQEADAMADRVMRMPEPENSDDDETTVQTKQQANQEVVAREHSIQLKGNGGNTPEVSSSTAANIHALKGGGSPLSRSALSFFEPRFGADFSQVRVHTNTQAAETANSINARAFTVGRNIAFGAEQYAPESLAGKQLLGHELTHVIQQNGSQSPQTSTSIQRTPNPADAESATTSGSGSTFAAPTHDCDINESNPIIWFDYNTANIRTTGGINSIVHLMSVIRRAQAHIAAAGPDAVIFLYGYASEEGKEAHNSDLSTLRANAIKGLLEDAGIASANLRAVGLGEDTSMGSLALNRRVEICPTPTIDYIDMPEETITADSMDCTAPTQAANLTQYAFLIRCLETQLASTHGPVDILRTLREIYYGSSKFDNAACGNSESGTVSSLNRSAAPLMAALRASKVTGRVDVGHIFTGLEGMLCPRSQTSPAWYAPSVNMANEDFLTWGGDIGSAAAGRLRGYNDSGWVFKSAPPWSRYFLTADSYASREDLLGDIDAFTFRANLRGVACSSTKGTRMPAPSTPISSLFLDFYSAPPGMATGLTSADRFRCFAEATGAVITGTNITNKPSLISRFSSQVFSFAHLFYLGMRKSHIFTIDLGDIMRLIDYSRQITSKFFDWIDLNIR